MLNTTNFPYFVSLAIKELPSFLESLGLQFLTRVGGLTYGFDGQNENDSTVGKVEFPLRGEDEKIIFTYHYLPGEEGTRGSICNLGNVLFRDMGSKTFLFQHVKHSCNCPYCLGMKYPFLPKGMSEERFRRMEAWERKNAIMKYIGR